MSQHAPSLHDDIAVHGGRYYTSSELALLERVYDRVRSELAQDGPAPEPETRTRVAKAIMDLAEAGILDPQTLETLVLKSVSIRP